MFIIAHLVLYRQKFLWFEARSEDSEVEAVLCAEDGGHDLGASDGAQQGRGQGPARLGTRPWEGL